MEQETNKLWKNERYCSTFEEADTLRNSLKLEDKTGFLQVKVKKSGDSSRYVVKTRIDPAMVNTLKDIEAQLETQKEKKNKKNKKEVSV